MPFKFAGTLNRVVIRLEDETRRKKEAQQAISMGQCGSSCKSTPGGYRFFNGQGPPWSARACPA